MAGALATLGVKEAFSLGSSRAAALSFSFGMSDNGGGSGGGFLFGGGGGGEADFSSRFSVGGDPLGHAGDGGGELLFVLWLGGPGGPADFALAPALVRSLVLRNLS